MTPKLRKKDKHLPQRVYFKHNAYYYVDKKNKWHKLGNTFSEAMTAWTKLVDNNSKIEIMNQLFDRYMTEIAPQKSKASYKINLVQIKPLRLAFGSMPPNEITPVHVYGYLDNRAKKAPVAANREKALLSHVFSLAIRWGIVRDNPCRLVKRITERPRNRYIEDWEYEAIKSISSPLIQNLMDFAYLTGQRIGDILSLQLNNISEDGIRIEQKKTGTKLLIQWTDELRELVQRIRKMPRSVIYSLTLFCNKKGGRLTYDGFSTQWEKVMKKALAEGLIKERFTFHDIRAKSSSDATNRQQASELLGHADPAITERIYNRKHKKVMPIR